VNKVKVTLKSGTDIEVLPQEVEGLRKARVLKVVSKQKKKTGKTKEEKKTGETKEDKKVPSGPIIKANFKGNF